MGKNKDIKKVLTLALIVILSSCAIVSEDLSQAKQYVEQNNYSEAILLLNSYKSTASKKYNAEVHLEVAEDILKDLDKPKLERYEEAKTYYEEAVRLDPKNTKARSFYLMILKLLKQQ